MKKTIVMMVACAAPVFAGEPAPVPAPAPAPAPQVSPWSCELGLSYSWASTDAVKGANFDKLQTIGVDLTGCYALDENNSLNLRFGYGWGDSSDAGMKLHTHNWTLMPGYRFTYPVDDTWSVYAGANIGLAATAWKVHEAGVHEHDSAWGFAYSAEVGVRYAICPNSDIFLGYIFSGSTAKPSGCEAQINHGIRAGLGMKF